MAQFGRALRSGRRSRRFKSCHLDQLYLPQNVRSPTFWGYFFIQQKILFIAVFITAFFVFIISRFLNKNAPYISDNDFVVSLSSI